MQKSKLGRPRKTHCLRGHELVPALKTRRVCLECNRIRHARWALRHGRVSDSNYHRVAAVAEGLE